MAITQVGTTVEQGITYGISKWCNELFSDGDWKPSELAKYSWCRWRDKYIGCCSATSTNIHSQQGAAVTQLLSYFNSSLSETSSNYVAYYNDSRIPTKEPYCFNILMYGRNGDQTLTSDCASNYRVVTSCSDFQSLYVLVNKYQPAQSTINVDYPTARTVNCNNLMWANGGVYNTNNNAHAQWITVWTVFVIDEDNFFVTRGMAFPNNTPCMYDGVIGAAQKNLRPSNDLSISYGNRITESKWRYYYGDITNYQKTMHLLRWYKNGITGIEPQTWGDSKYGVYDIDDDVAIIMRSANAVYGSIGIRYTYYLKSDVAVKNAIAYTGLRWKYQEGDTTHVYTPIIDADGYITGYTTDPDTYSKLNEIDDVVNNGITPLPPAPPTPSEDDDYTSMGLGIVGFFGGIVNYAVLDKDELETLIADFESHASSHPGMSIIQNIISLYKLGMTSSLLVTTTSKPIVMSVGSGGSKFTSANNYSVIDGQPTVDLGSVDVPRMTNTFYDFSPYTSYELFVPGCGWIQLPDTVAGRKIQVHLVHDIATCSCRGIVRIGMSDVPGEENGTTIAVINGITGTQMPITLNESGLKSGAIIQASANAVSGLVMGGLGAAAGNPFVAIGGASEAIGGMLNATLVGNTNYTAVKGGPQDMSVFGDGYTAVLKINYPDIQDVVNNYERFGHTVGYLCNKWGAIGDFTGFTVCDNPHVSGFSCTSDEKDEIERLLKEGIIIHQPSE